MLGGTLPLVIIRAYFVACAEIDYLEIKKLFQPEINVFANGISQELRIVGVTQIIFEKYGAFCSFSLCKC